MWGKRFLFYERKDPIKIHWYEFPSLFLCSAQTHAHMWFKCRLSWPLFGKYHFHFKVWFGFFVEYRLSCTALACTTEGCLQWLQITPVSGSSLLVESWPPRIVRTNIYNVNNILCVKSGGDAERMHLNFVTFYFSCILNWFIFFFWLFWSWWWLQLEKGCGPCIEQLLVWGRKR